jgi:hypothetical protein
MFSAVLKAELLLSTLIQVLKFRRRNMLSNAIELKKVALRIFIL